MSTPLNSTHPSPTASSRPLQNAYKGSLVADALSMPVHWYYNRPALDRDYGSIDRFHAPRNPHPDSILWRSSYQPAAPGYDLLHDQARYWGQRDIHYHQFLKAGENTLNFKLARELYHWTCDRGSYDAEAWLEHYVEVLSTPGWHRDTYVEEVHRTFFENAAKGTPLKKCAVKDLHIGALAQVPALLAALEKLPPYQSESFESIIVAHVALTHHHPQALQAARILTRLLLALAGGATITKALQSEATNFVSLKNFEAWSKKTDREVVGDLLTPACYLPESMTAACYLCWKYQTDPGKGFQANAEVGGDNCHRGAVVGSLLSIANGPPVFT